MKAALLLVDLQRDFLEAPGLDPAAGEVVANAARLLAGARERGIPVIHVVTSIDPSHDDRMPHWKTQHRWMCVPGTPGHESPLSLRASDGEPVVRKTQFSAFSSAELDRALTAAACDTLILAGIHLHGCVRATALDAYARRFDVWIADDAVGSYDRLHAASTRRYLEGRAARFLPVAGILGRLSNGSRPALPNVEPLPAAIIAGQPRRTRPTPVWTHASPRWREELLFAVPSAVPAIAAEAAAAAGRAQREWARRPFAERAETLRRLAELLEREAILLARQMALEIGKPVSMGEAEVRRAGALLRTAAAQTESEPRRCGPDSISRRRPLGVVAAITPWNNPVAIPAGKIGPALLFGNAVVWKPAPTATNVSLQLMRIFRESGLPDGVVNLVAGGREAAAAVLASPDVSAATISGSSRSGFAAQEICAARRIPLQAELGGNNAAIVWEGADLRSAAGLIAHGAFEFAGQRCTANRRVIIGQQLKDRFLDDLVEAAGQIRWQDPVRPESEAGPLISDEACDRVAGVVARASTGPATVISCDKDSAVASLCELGSYHPPAVIVDPDPSSEIVQEETFGPVLVLQTATDFDHALELVNGVSQGLVAALIGGSSAQRERFLDEAAVGIVKLDRSTADADAAAPFGGWKSSGVGPPEHGAAAREFFTREQTVYHSP
jgi:acyl-CoA reductase-like NAD-dependent aldehyde dehydrogenase/nicotinamidase-related amidase